jgi:riboflavin transporter FmnP
MGVFVIFIWFFTKSSDEFSVKRFILGGVVGTLALTAVMALLNAVYAIPMYEKFANFSLVSVHMTLTKWIVAMVLPFNLIQGAILTVVGQQVLLP